MSDFNPSVTIKIGENLSNLLKNSDFILFNLEGSPNFASFNNKKNQILKFDVEAFYNFLYKYGVNKFIVSIANNHILDNGIGNFKRFLNFLDSKGIKYVGSKSIPFIEIEDFLIYSVVSWETGITEPYFKYLNSLKFNHDKVQKIIDNNLDKKIIIYPHWGMDLYQKPTKNHMDFVNKNIKKNNVYIYGHHPHLIIENDSKVNYLFSLGNTYVPHPNYYQRFHKPLRCSKAVLLTTISKDVRVSFINIFYDGNKLDVVTNINQKDIILKGNLRKFPRPKGITIYDYFLKSLLKTTNIITSSKIYRYFRNKTKNKSIEVNL